MVIHDNYIMGFMVSNMEFINKNGDIYIDIKWLINSDYWWLMIMGFTLW